MGLNVVLLSVDEFLGMKVLYCLDSIGATVHVMGTAKSRFMRTSRYCHRFVPVELPETPSKAAAFVEWADRYAKDNAIDIFVSSDETTADCLYTIRERLSHSKCFPVGGMKQYDALHDKWRFAEFLRTNDIPGPRTALISNQGDLTPGHLSNVGFPVMVKPLALWGGAGVVKIDTLEELCAHVRGHSPDNQLPLIVQEFIPGDDVDLSILAIDGDLVAWTVQRWLKPGTLEFSENPELVEIGRKIARLRKYQGVAHFDMRRDARDGSLVVVECNPRFWFSLPASACHGVNFVGLGIDWALGAPPARQTAYRPGRYYLPKAMLTARFWRLSTFENLTKENARAFVQVISDPLPLLYYLTRDCWESLSDLYKAVVKLLRRKPAI